MRQFEQMDVYTPNTANGISSARDKLRANQILSRHNIAMPPTAFVRNRADVRPAIERVGGAPVVIKLLEGTQGIGVILAPQVKVAEAIIETLHSTKQNVLIQRFIAESRGRDIRALVVGDRVVAAMRRVANGDEFRSNVHRGGTVEAVTLDPLYEQTAVRAAQIMGLRVAGVDMLEGEDGPLVMEVNSSPGLQGIEAATGLDVAGAIIDFIANQVNFPEIDVRQRLSVSTGYGVAELLIHAGAEQVGKQLGDLGLWDRDITVLTLHRGVTVIPNPRKHVVLQDEDRLLCFGKLDEMRSMIPERRRRGPRCASSARSTCRTARPEPATPRGVHERSARTREESGRFVLRGGRSRRRSARARGAGAERVDALRDRQRGDGLRHRLHALDDRGHGGVVDRLRELLDGARELLDRDVVVAVAHVEHVHRHALRDAHRLGPLVLDEPGQASARSFGHDDDAAAADRAVHRVLRLRVHADRDLGALPVAAERGAEHVTGSPRHAVDLAVHGRAWTSAS